MFKKIKNDWKAIRKPDKKDVFKNTLFIVVTTTISALIISGADAGFQAIINLFYR